MTRPLLENGVGRRLLRLPNICLRQRSGVEQPIFDHDQGRILGVRVRSREGADGVEAMTADLVVDATGRGSRCAAWLNALGYAAPREETIEVGAGNMTFCPSVLGPSPTPFCDIAVVGPPSCSSSKY
jgi:hypothetical protein